MATVPLLDMQNVRVMRGEKLALDISDLRIQVNEHIVILGPNGCGKSTLIKTIMRECYPVADEGTCINILGKQRWNIFELRSMLGIVSNDLLASCTGEASGLDVVLSGFFSSAAIYPNHHVGPRQVERAAGVLTRLGITHLAQRPVCEMSSGEAKRVLIARALVHAPRTLLFDEPCNSLDIAAQRVLRDTMRSLANSGTGTILVTHELADIIPEIERVVLLSRGRIVADGPKEEVLCAESLRELFGVDVTLARRDGHYHVW